MCFIIMLFSYSILSWRLKSFHLSIKFHLLTAGLVIAKNDEFQDLPSKIHSVNLQIVFKGQTWTTINFLFFGLETFFRSIVFYIIRYISTCNDWQIRICTLYLLKKLQKMWKFQVFPNLLNQTIETETEMNIKLIEPEFT